MNQLMRTLPVLIALAIPTFCAQAQVTQAPRPGPGVQTPVRAAGAQASPAERAQLARQFVNKWGPYVQRIYGVKTATWARRIGPSLGTVDGDNLRNALNRDTYEAAMAELTGDGSRFTDTQMKSRLMATGGEKVLGALGNDVVYTPIQPCRIVDTRSTAAGAIAANSTRSFVGVNASNFTSQGGSSTNCGTLGLSATALALNVTAVTPGTAGYATVYPFGTAQPTTASVNYTAGAIVNNAIIAQIPNPLSSFDFTVYTFAQSHFVVDIVGYFAPPVATALQCQDTANTTVANIAAGGTANANAPACPTGYTQTATNCETSSWLMPIVFSHAGTCSARNNDATPQDLRASRTCCRVPGR